MYHLNTATTASRMSLVVAQPVPAEPKPFAPPIPVVEAQGEGGPPLPPPPPPPSVEVEAVRPPAAEVLFDGMKGEASPAATPTFEAPPITIKISSTHGLYKAIPPQEPLQPPHQQPPHQQQPPQQQQLQRFDYFKDPHFPLAPHSTKLDASTAFAVAAAQGIAAAKQGGDEGISVAEARQRRERQVPAWYKGFLDGKVVDKYDREETRFIKRAKER